MSTATTLTDKKTRPGAVYTVLSSVLGTHQRPDAPLNQPKLFGELVTAEELGPDCDVARLLKLGAIKEGVILPADLPDRGDPNRPDFRGERRVNPPPPTPEQFGLTGVRSGVLAPS